MTEITSTKILEPVVFDNDDETPNLATYAQKAYLEYALSVVKGRALPDVCDGQKPVQRRILFSMSRMGLGFGGSNGNTGAKPVKCARVVGDVLGRYHPHGDTAAYDALVRMAQDFSQRYPLIDGHGNFGSRDGDGAAAMRYTEARLAKISSLLLDEIDEDTVNFIANYDGSTEEPSQLPARLPFTMLNGASGIAVGLATEIPSHNLREVADTCIALIKSPDLSEEEFFNLIPGPDFPGGGQIISSATDIADAYRTGRGSLRCRARWKIEELARNQWKLVIYELPPGVSTQCVLEEIEELTNPKIKAGKKALSIEQNQMKAAMLAVLDLVRDESSKDAAVRLVFEPKTNKIEQQDLINTLLAHTSLESTNPINLTMIGFDGRPKQKSLRQMFNEWISFRQTTIERRSNYRLNKVLDRIHILEGRALVLLNIDEVIAIIRQADDPKADLMNRFKLSERQAEDILEIRLRQLARLEAIKIEQELSGLRGEQKKLDEILGNSRVLRNLMIKEIEHDAKIFADPRRTLIQPVKKAVLEVKVVDEPVTIVVSQKGWVRAQKGWARDRAGGATTPVEYTFKAGDSLYGTFECRSIDNLLIFGSNGRIYSVAVSLLPGARGDGQPITSMIELESGTQPLYYFAGSMSTTLLISSSGGYGFLASVNDMYSKFKGGKSFITVNPGETLRPYSIVNCESGSLPIVAANYIACVSSLNHILTFPISELKTMPKGGRGMVLISIEDKETLVGAVAYNKNVRIQGIGRGNTEREEILEIRSLNNALSVRARKGKIVNLGFKPLSITRIG